MLHQSTNPPPIVSRQKRAPRVAQSALDVISASIQPIETDNGGDLLDVLCYMKDENDVRGMMDLYEFFAATASTSLNAANVPRTTRRAKEFIDREDGQTWAKAYLVADFLKDMKPDRYDVERYSEIMFSCTLQMGNNLAEAVAVINEIVSWELERPLPRGMMR